MTTAELIEDAQVRETRVQERRAALEAHFQGVAQDRPWYDGIFGHQWIGACYGAVAKRWFLGDEPGAGKTRTSIGWLDLVGAKKVILVAEANVCAQFAGEVSDLAPHRTIINLAGLSKVTRHERLNKMLKLTEGIIVINYEMFRRDEEALGKVLIWQADTLLVDEAHNIKSTKTANFKYIEQMAFTDNMCPECSGLIYGLGKVCGGCGWNIKQHLDVYDGPGPDYGMGYYERKWRHAAIEDKQMFLSTKSVKNVLMMTGTPLLNSPVDLFSIFHLIDPVRFPSEARFKREFTHPDYSMNRHVFSRQGLEKLSPMLKGRYLARTLPEVGIDLPKQHLHIERVEIDPKTYPLQARTIEQVRKHAAIMLSTGEQATLMHAITVILRSRQANTWPGGIEFKDADGNVIFSVGQEVQESAKMDAALARIKEFHKKGARQVVFSQFQTALIEFEKRLTAAGFRAVRFDGSTPKPLREEIKNNFYAAKGEESKWDVVLVHPRTGGAGLNLTAATVTHILDEEWNAGKNEQMYARTHRLGQQSITHLIIYRATGVDIWMANLIASKKRMVERLGQAMSGEQQTKLIIDAVKNGEI